MSFSNVGYEEAMRRARDCVPLLKERARKCEDARVLLPENEKLLHETGLFRFHQPKRFGGMELPFIAVVDIVAELARGCPSTVWNVGNLGCHHWILAYYEPRTQHELWDENPDALIASSIALAAGRGRIAKDGVVVSGRWPFSSGVDNSQWNMLAVTIYEDGPFRTTAKDMITVTVKDLLDEPETTHIPDQRGGGGRDVRPWRNPSRRPRRPIRKLTEARTHRLAGRRARTALLR